MNAAGLAALGLLVVLASPAAGQIYRWVDEQGNVHYTQSLDNVPERHRNPALSPTERAVALETLAALKEFQRMVGPGMTGHEYHSRLRRVEDAVRRMPRSITLGPVRTHLGAAWGHYNVAGMVFSVGPTGWRLPLLTHEQRCPRTMRLLAAPPDEHRQAAEDRLIALEALWACAGDHIAAAEDLLR